MEHEPLSLIYDQSAGGEQTFYRQRCASGKDAALSGPNAKRARVVSHRSFRAAGKMVLSGHIATTRQGESVTFGSDLPARNSLAFEMC
jgi:hypothetical protein